MHNAELGCARLTQLGRAARGSICQTIKNNYNYFH